MSEIAERVRTVVERLADSRARLANGDERIVEDQVALAEIPSPTGSEAKRAAFVAARFKAAGLSDVHTDSAGNVVASCGGEAGLAPVVICAHLDTVFDAATPLGVRRDGVRLVGPGISDNARGLATMLRIAEEFGAGRVRARHPVIFAATTGEEGEGDLRGARHLFATAARGACAAVAIDGAGDERVVASALGSRRYRITFRGPGGHSWAAYGSPNALHAAGTLIASLGDLALPARPRTTLTVARAAGGTAINAIPADAWLEVDIRSTSPRELERVDHTLRDLATYAAEEENAHRRTGTPPLAVTIASLGERPAGEVSRDEPIVRVAVEATRLIGRTPEYAIASTDANIPISLGIPAIAIGGGGRGGETHTPAEWFEDDRGAEGVLRALVIVAALAGAGEDGAAPQPR